VKIVNSKQVQYQLGLIHQVSRQQMQSQISNSRSGNQPISSGVEVNFGEFFYELNEKLQGPSRFDVWEEMSNDPHIKGGLRLNTLPLKKARWDIVPADKSPEAQDHADFCKANLLRIPTKKYGAEYFIQTPWKAQRIDEVLRFLQDGFALFVGTMKRVDLFKVFSRLQWVEPKTLQGTEPWVLDHDDTILGVKRTYQDPKSLNFVDEEIPARRLFLYGWEIIGARYPGNPLIRSQYGPWMRKDFIQRMGAIWAQKVGAPPPWGSYPQGTEHNTIRRFEEFVQSLRGTAPAEAYFFGEQGKEQDFQVGYAGADVGDVDRMRSLIDGENREISHGLGSVTQNLGETGTGNRALGGIIGMLEMVMVEAIGETIGEQETGGIGNLRGPIQVLIDENFGPQHSYPTLEVSNVNPLFFIQSVDKLAAAVNAGLVPKHPLVKRQVTEAWGFKLPDDAFEEEEKPPRRPPPGDKEGDEDEVDPTEDEKEGDGLDDEEPEEEPEEGLTVLEARLDRFRKRVAPLLEAAAGKEEATRKGGRFPRAPNRAETEIVRLQAVDEAFRVGEEETLGELKRINAMMIKDLMNRLESGKVSRRTLDGLRRSKFKGQRGAIVSLTEVFKRIGVTGTEHVEEELKRAEEILR
jgi:hypothetical protein